MLGARRPVLMATTPRRRATTRRKVADNFFTSTRRDGTTVLLRRLEPSDTDAVVALPEALSDREIYLRFFTTHSADLNALADTLTHANGNGYALGAFESERLIGVAHYAMCSKPATADIAVVVDHDDHRRGVGTALVLRLAQIAHANGIEHLVADILATNYLMFEVLHDAGLHPQHKSYDIGVVHLDIDLTTVLQRSVEG